MNRLYLYYQNTETFLSKYNVRTISGVATHLVFCLAELSKCKKVIRSVLVILLALVNAIRIYNTTVVRY